MKNVLRVLIVAAFVTAFALPTLAQDAAATPTPAAQAGPCTTEVDAKAAMYQKFLANYKGTPEQQKTASDTGKEYLSKYGACPDAGDKQIADFIQKWAGKYDAAVEEFACTDAFNKKDYAKAFQACQVILAKQPDNVEKVLLLARGGYANVTSATPNKSLNAESARMARRAVELIQSGKTPAKWDPFPNKEEALGFLYYSQGVFALETDPTAASAAFIKAAQSNSLFKNESSTYTYLATIYETTELKKLVDAYTAAFPPGNPIPDEKKAQYDEMFLQISKVQDRIIDAYARAYAILKADPKADAVRTKAVLNKLTTYYKARHEDKEDGLQELIASVLSKPLMLPGQEPTTLPAPATSAVPSTNGAPKTGATTPAATTPANGTKPAASPATTTPASGTKPAPKPQSKTTKPAAKSAATTSGH
ncbi:MAG TPA: hypothetical protein VM914_04525 [Pyrinomonadaceae bacterium]|jgi:hypothetical protein|nr:hypothetical protein [Pyrinomonadaceae bacterium]